MQSAKFSGRPARPGETIEAKLRKEAEQFVKRRFLAAPPPILSALTQHATDGQQAGGNMPVAADVLAHLHKALRRERLKSRLGHAGYDFNRHLALHQAIRHLSKQATVPTGQTLPGQSPLRQARP